MYNYTVDELHSKILQNISNEYEKTVGFPTYDLTKSFSIQEYAIYQVLNSMMDKLDVDKLTGDELTKYVYQRKGVTRKPSNKAKGIITVKGNGTINIGDLFSTSNAVEFRATESKPIVGSGNIKIEALLAGTSGNVGANTITQIPITLQGIVSVTNSTPTYDGYEEESDNNLRERYYKALQLPATSGNMYHYITWANSITGVGGAKVFPLWKGDNTVKIVIIDSDKQPANADLVNRVQNYIDPNVSGDGSGEAPIGAYCTVVSAVAKPINISVDVELIDNYQLTDVLNNIKNNLTEYLKSIAFVSNQVSYARVGSIILDTEGVKDYTTFTLNNALANVAIADEEVAIIGDVVVI